MTQDEFVKGTENWDNYKPLLWLALEETRGEILELGCGNGSTPVLTKYSEDTGRKLRSYDYNKEWASKFPNAIHVENWNGFDFEIPVSVALVDESPGSQRRISIQRLRTNAEIIIVHDSEPKGWNASDYKVRPIFKDFKYVVEIKSKEPQGAWATALSETIDITKWIGLEIEGFKIVAYEPRD